MCDTFDLPFLPPGETPQAASEKATSPEPPDMLETEEVHVSPEPQEPRPARTSKKDGDGFSEEEVPHHLGGGGVVVDMRTELATLIRS